MATKLATAFVEVVGRTGKFDQDMDALEKRSRSRFAALGGMAGKAVAVAATGAALAAGVSLRAFANFEKGMNEVFTLIPDASDKAKDQMIDDVKELSRQMGVLPEQVVPALYQALSAGVPPENVFEFLRTAQKGAIGGVTDLLTSVDGLTTVVNAFAAQDLDAADAADIFFTTVKAGKTTFAELSRSMFNVAPQAASVGLRFQEVAAALATLTTQGTPTKVASTYIRGALNELTKEGTDAADTFKRLSGKTFRDFVASGGTLQEALTMLAAEAEKNGKSVKDMFGSVEAGSAAVVLAGSGAQTFGKILGMMGDRAGAADTAYQQMAQGLVHQTNLAKAAMQVSLVEMGDMLAVVVAPALQKLAELAQQLAGWFTSLSEQEQQATLKITGYVVAGLALGKVIAVVSNLGSALGGLVTAATAGKLALAGLAAYGIFVLTKAVYEMNGAIREFNNQLQFSHRLNDQLASGWIGKWHDRVEAVQEIEDPFERMGAAQEEARKLNVEAQGYYRAYQGQLKKIDDMSKTMADRIKNRLFIKQAEQEAANQKRLLEGAGAAIKELQGIEKSAVKEMKLEGEQNVAEAKAKGLIPETTKPGQEMTPVDAMAKMAGKVNIGDAFEGVVSSAKDMGKNLMSGFGKDKKQAAIDLAQVAFGALTGGLSGAATSAGLIGARRTMKPGEEEEEKKQIEERGRTVGFAELQRQLQMRMLEQNTATQQRNQLITTAGQQLQTQQKSEGLLQQIAQNLGMPGLAPGNA